MSVQKTRGYAIAEAKNVAQMANGGEEEAKTQPVPEWATGRRLSLSTRACRSASGASRPRGLQATSSTCVACELNIVSQALTNAINSALLVTSK